MSSHSQRSSRSRPQSGIFPAFPSSLAYALVRDFAYPTFHPMHYGSPSEPPSGSSTPGSEWNAGRRQSEPLGERGTGGWSAGPWSSDGILYGDPDVQDPMDPLPSTSFHDDSQSGVGEDFGSSSRSKQRKSKSYANISDYERGRRRESGAHSQRRSRLTSGEPDAFLFSGQQSDSAGRDSLRQSRSQGLHNASEPAGARRDLHTGGATTLAARSFHTSQPSTPALGAVDPDSDLPLDSEIPSSPTSPQRQSMGPEDEELFAGESLALYSFEPENANELKLTEGQHILVSYRHGQGWLVAEDKETGEQGLVPEEYVRLISEIPNYDPLARRFLTVEEIGGDEMEGMEEGEDVEDGGDEETGMDVSEGGNARTATSERNIRVDEVLHETMEAKHEPPDQVTGEHLDMR